jgi:glycosyltransferase involved in cell wall biosynthesis
MMPLRLCLVVESGTDVRLVEGLVESFDLTILARKVEGGVEVSHPPAISVPSVVGSASRLEFAMLVWRHLRQYRQRIDFVLVQGYGLAALAANLASRFTGTPTAMLVCSPTEAYYRCRRAHPGPDKPFRRRELWVLHALARMNGLIGRQYIVLSQHLADVVRGHRIRKPVDIVPIYGVDTKIFSPPEASKPSIKARLKLPTSGSLILCSSRVAPEKDSEALLAAVQRLLDEGRDLWLLHRSGGYRTFLQHAERFGIAERVIATDAVHPYRQLPGDYQASDLYVQASREEGLGFSALEALACGVPVIAAAVGGLKETIMDGKTGWTYPVGDWKTLARRIEEALDELAEAARRAAAGRGLVCEKYDSRMAFRQLSKVIGRSQMLEPSRECVGAS